MSSDDGFAFLLPFIFISFGCIFLVLARWSPGPASRWGLGYLSAAGGFTIPWVLQSIPPQAQASIADFLFLAAAYLNSEALFLHFGPVRFQRLRLGFATIMYAATLYAVHMRESLPLELMFGDIGFVVLMAFPLIFVWRQARQLSERLLLGMAALVVFNTVIRNVVMVALFNPGNIEGFAQSHYAYMMQATDAALGMLLALSAIATMVLGMLGRYRDAAERDPMTRLLNRRGFERIAPDFRGRTFQASAIIVCDIDHFKSINDSYGHATGDRVLIAFAEQLQSFTPASGFVSRFGGEEFVIYLPRLSAADAEHVANTVRLAFANHDWREIDISVQVTASFGIGVSEQGDHSIHDAIARADTALYEAKAAGRNRVVIQPKSTSSRNPTLRVISAM